MKKLLNSNSALGKCIENKDGVAAIEFALIAPIMIAIYLGLAEVSLLVAADRKVSHAASVTGDLVSQVETINATEMGDILSATLAVMGTNPTTMSDLTIDLRSFEKDSSGNVNEVGYAKVGSGLTTKFDGTTVNARLLNETSGLVVARISYVYRSPTKEFVGTPTLKETFMLKPRKSATIPFTSNAGVPSTISCTFSSLNGKAKVGCT